jgi:hypothetical protein
MTTRSLRETLEADAALSFPCRRCGTALADVEVEPVLRVLFPELACHPRLSHTPTATIQSAPPPQIAPPTPPPPRLRLAQSAALIGVTLGGVALGLFGMRTWADPPARSAGVTLPVAPPAASSGPGTAPAPSSAAPPPEPVEQEAVVSTEGARVTATGEGDTEEAALLDARSRALVRFAGLVRRNLRSVPIRVLVDEQLKGGEAPAAQVASRWLWLAGAVATPERVGVKLSRLGPRSRATARYSLTAEAFSRAQTIFDRTVLFGGATLGALFPLVPGPAEGGVVVVEVPAASLAARAGLRPGDLLLRLDDRPTPTLDALAQLLAETTGPRTQMVTLLRDKEEKTVRVRR